MLPGRTAATLAGGRRRRVDEPMHWGVLAMQHDLGWSQTALTGACAVAIIVSEVTAIPVGR
jgi:hypothetical protein